MPKQNTRFSHINQAGDPEMVDVSQKTPTRRTATARGLMAMPQVVMEKLNEGDIRSPKGSVFQTAILAGIMGAKKTGELIPLCHPLGLEDCQLTIEVRESNVLEIRAYTVLTGKTGVEMEALTAVSIAALTIYDMCKALSKDIAITEIRLLEKTGGKSDYRTT